MAIGRCLCVGGGGACISICDMCMVFEVWYACVHMCTCCIVCEGHAHKMPACAVICMHVYAECHGPPSHSPNANCSWILLPLLLDPNTNCSWILLPLLLTECYC